MPLRLHLCPHLLPGFLLTSEPSILLLGRLLFRQLDRIDHPLSSCTDRFLLRFLLLRVTRRSNPLFLLLLPALLLFLLLLPLLLMLLFLLILILILILCFVLNVLTVRLVLQILFLKRHDLLLLLLLQLSRPEKTCLCLRDRLLSPV